MVFVWMLSQSMEPQSRCHRHLAFHVFVEGVWLRMDLHVKHHRYVWKRNLSLMFHVFLCSRRQLGSARHFFSRFSPPPLWCPTRRMSTPHARARFLSVFFHGELGQSLKVSFTLVNGSAQLGSLSVPMPGSLGLTCSPHDRWAGPTGDVPPGVGWGLA